MGNPRRKFEHAMFITLSTTMVSAFAFLIAYSRQPGQDGRPRGLERVELDDKVDLAEQWEELKSVSKGMIWGSSSSTSAGNHGKSASASGDDDKKGGPSQSK